jgi:hypothetical protein
MVGRKRDVTIVCKILVSRHVPRTQPAGRLDTESKTGIIRTVLKITKMWLVRYDTKSASLVLNLTYSPPHSVTTFCEANSIGCSV